MTRNSLLGAKKLFVFLCVVTVLFGLYFFSSTNHKIDFVSASHTSSLRSPTIPESPAKTHSFQAVTRNSLYVFSAYLDKGLIRVLGIKLQTYNDPLQCQVRVAIPQGNADPSFEVNATLETIPEHHGQPYTACYILCPIPPHIIPLSVSITPHSSRNYNVTFDLLTRYTWSTDFTVCVAPLHHSYNNQFDLVEMIELNRILGAEKFFVYNYSIGPDVDKVLKHYTDKHVVEVIAWPLPVAKDKIHYYGQLVAMNDCVYRNRYRSGHVVFQDLDEFIVPGGNWSSWKEVVFHRKFGHPKATVFQFRNVFFRKEWVREPGNGSYPLKDKVSKWRSVVLKNVYKEDEIYPYNQRTKCIVNPLGVETVGIHNIWKSLGYIDRVPIEAGFLHHYRNRYNYKDPRRRVYDDSVVTKFGAQLMNKVETTWKEIGLSSLKRV